MKISGTYEKVGRTYKFTFQFSHRIIDKFDHRGLPVYKEVLKTQVTYGVTKKECKENALKTLNVEAHEKNHLFMRIKNQPNLLDGYGVCL